MPVSQIYGTTGRRRRSRIREMLDAQAAYLPFLYAEKERRETVESEAEERRRQFEEEQKLFREGIASSEKTATAGRESAEDTAARNREQAEQFEIARTGFAEKQAKTANIISGAGTVAAGTIAALKIKSLLAGSTAVATGAGVGAGAGAGSAFGAFGADLGATAASPGFLATAAPIAAPIAVAAAGAYTYYSQRKKRREAGRHEQLIPARQGTQRTERELGSYSPFSVSGVEAFVPGSEQLGPQPLLFDIDRKSITGSDPYKIRGVRAGSGASEDIGVINYAQSPDYFNQVLAGTNIGDVYRDYTGFQGLDVTTGSRDPKFAGTRPVKPLPGVKPNVSKYLDPERVGQYQRSYYN